MTQEQLDELVAKLSDQAAKRIKDGFADMQTAAKKAAEETVKNGGYLTDTQFKEFQDANKTFETEVKEILKTQGESIGSLTEKVGTNGKGAKKSIAQLLKEKESELKRVFQNGTGNMEFLLEQKSTGEVIMRPFDRNKAAGPVATVDDIGDPSNVASITQSLLTSTLLRVGGNSEIVSQYRNTPWVFDLINVTTSEYVSGAPYVMYYEEVAKTGASTTVAEGGTKPKVQYAYKLVSKEYKKEAQLVQFTEEFSIDFRRLQDDILNKGRVDLLNRINSEVLANIITAATLYNTETEFGTVPFVNDFDVIAAMAAQVDDATFGMQTNAAIMSTFKKYKMGITKDEMGAYLNRPEVLGGISFVGNPDMGADAIVVGDLKQYNMIQRGGIIVRIGYNGTDFAENKFSVVMEQFYFDYISDVRKAAIVKGANFATVKALLTDESA